MLFYYHLFRKSKMVWNNFEMVSCCLLGKLNRLFRIQITILIKNLISIFHSLCEKATEWRFYLNAQFKYRLFFIIKKMSAIFFKSLGYSQVFPYSTETFIQTKKVGYVCIFMVNVSRTLKNNKKNLQKLIISFEICVLIL